MDDNTPQDKLDHTAPETRTNPARPSHPGGDVDPGATANPQPLSKELPMQDNTTSSATPASVLLDPAAFCVPPHARISGQKRNYIADLKIGKPGPADWVRIHPDTSLHWRYINAREDRNHNFYILAPGLYEQLENRVQRVFGLCQFFVTATLNADPFLWLVKHSKTDYFETMLEAVQAAMTGWVQVQSNQDKKCYEFNPPSADYSDPDWSSMLGEATPQELFTRVFKGRVIDSVDHEQLERIRGRK